MQVPVQGPAMYINVTSLRSRATRVVDTYLLTVGQALLLPVQPEQPAVPLRYSCRIPNAPAIGGRGYA